LECYLLNDRDNNNKFYEELVSERSDNSVFLRQLNDIKKQKSIKFFVNTFQIVLLKLYRFINIINQKEWLCEQ
jgi:hypothetical protein